MTETLVDLTTDEERESSSKERDDSLIMTLTSVMLNLLTKKSKDLLSSHLCLFVFGKINERVTKSVFSLF